MIDLIDLHITVIIGFADDRRVKTAFILNQCHNKGKINVVPGTKVICKFEFGDNPIYLEKTFAEKNETRMHQIGDVITVHTGDVGTSAVITENEAKSIGFATIVTRPNPKIIDSNYLCSFLNTDKHKKWAVSISTGDGRTNYNLGDYFELVVPVPSIAEQKKIASYIQKLNRLITLHQRKPVVVNSSSTMNALPNQHLYFQVLE